MICCGCEKQLDAEHIGSDCPVYVAIENGTMRVVEQLGGVSGITYCNICRQRCSEMTLISLFVEGVISPTLGAVICKTCTKAICMEPI